MQSITLQTNDSIVSSGDFLGQIQFAASNELDAGASRYIIGRIYSEAEGSFTSSANPASLVFATSANDNLPASGKIKISHDGHILPLLDNTYDLGSPDLRFRDLYVTSEVTSPSGNFNEIFFNTSLADVDQIEGQLNWNDTLGTLDLGLTDTLSTHLGQDVYYRVINLSGGTIYQGQPVYAAGVNAGGQRIEIGKFVADGSIAEVRYIGLLAETLNQGDIGYVVHFGHVRKVDLRSSNTALNPNAETWAAGDILFPDPSTAGGLTKVPPQDIIYTAIVLTDGQNGELLVRITDPGHINDLHDVNTSGLVDNNLLVWNSGADYWEPSSGLYFVDGDLGVGTDSPNATLHVYNSTPSGTIFNAEGTNGSLFSVVDNLSGVLMSVNTIAGLPVLEVNSDYSITAGRFNQNDFVLTASGDIGMGIAAPSGKLHVVGEVYVDNLKLDGNTLSSTDANGNIYITPNGTGGIGGGTNSTVSGPYNIVAGGKSNVSSGSRSTVSGGQNNCATNTYSTVSGGYTNSATGCASTVGGGRSNSASSICSTIGGGWLNTVTGSVSAILGGAKNSVGVCYSTLSGGYCNSITGRFGSLVGGIFNCVPGYGSFIGGGRENSTNCTYSSIVGGCGNSSSALYNFIGGGYSNVVAGDYGAIVAGSGNNICTGGSYSFIGGGGGNYTTNSYSVVAGGGNNSTYGHWAAVLGGASNAAYGSYATAGGGIYNRACAGYSFVGGGYANTVYPSAGSYSAIVNGRDNKVENAAGCSAFIGAGCCNVVASGNYATVVNGAFNVASGDYSAVVAGSGNLSKAAYSTISAGYQNYITCQNSFIGGGIYNRVTGANAAVVAGYINCANGINSAVVGGRSNTASGSYSFIGNGYLNCSTASYASVVGGHRNCATHNYTFVGAGYCNVATMPRSSVVGGELNCSSAYYSFIGGGLSNSVTGECSSVVGGSHNSVTGQYSAVVAGSGNIANECYSIVGGGYNNLVNVGAIASVIAGGIANVVCANNIYSTIGGGIGNYARATRVTIAGGCHNQAYGLASAIGGGFCNVINNNYGTVGGGRQNTASCIYATIAGGCLNTASHAYATVAGGQGNCAAGARSFIGAGRNNCVTSLGTYSNILGGCSNSSSGAYSSILGGALNDNNGKAFSFILGSGITATAPHTTYTESLSVSNVNDPSGTIFNVEGSNGSLFSVVDNLSGVLMSVNNNAGLPVFEVYDDDSIIAGRFAQNDFVIASNGDIGMGIAAPSGKLHVVGDSYFNNTIYIHATGVATSYTYNKIYADPTYDHLILQGGGNTITLGGQSGHVSIDASSTFIDIGNGYNAGTNNQYIRFTPANTEAMRITNAGDVGIGTASPGYKLHVAGDISANANNIYGGGFSIYADTNNKLTKSGNDFTLSAGQTTTDVHLGYYDGGTLNKVLTVDSSEDRVGILNTTPAYTLDVTGSGNFTGGLYAGGNLGVGTTSPLSKLHVMGDARIQGDSTNTTWTSPSPTLAIKRANDNPYMSFHRDNGNRLGYLQFNANSPVVFLTEAGYGMSFFAGGYNRLHIENGGDVGIGTDNPQYKLDVNGDSNLGGNVIVGGNLTVNGTTISTNVDTIEIQDPIITLGLTSGNIVTDDSYDRGVAMVTNDGTAFMGWDNSEDKFVMLSSGVATNGSGNYDAGTYGDLQIADLTASGATFDGNVGIGTASPSYDLHVDGDIATKAIKLYDSSYGIYDRNIVAAGNNITFQNAHAIAAFSVGVRSNRGTSVGMESDGINGYLALAAGGSEKVRIATNGNVGIGDTTPSYKLDVAGTTAITPTAATDTLILGRLSGQSNIKATTNTHMIIDSDGTAFAGINYYDAGDVVLAYGGGNVGIGTATPSYKLDILGGSTSQSTVARIKTAYSSLSNNNYALHVDSSSHTSNMTTAGAMAVDVYGGRAFTINGQGNVGVGTNTPTTLLDVSGVITADGGNSDQWNEAYDWVQNSGLDGTGAASGVAFWTDSNTLSYDSGLIWDSTNDRLGINTTSPGATLDVRGPAVFNENGSAHNFRIESNNDSSMFFVDGTNDKVGIGTGSPTRTLHVDGDGRVADLHIYNTSSTSVPGSVSISAGATLLCTNPGLNTNQLMLESNNNNVTVGNRLSATSIGIGSNANILSGSNSVFNISSFSYTNFDNTGTYANSSYIFKQGGSEVFRIHTGGNVGIGTTSPSWKLQVQSTSDNIASFTNGGYIGLDVTRNNTSYAAINIKDSGGRSIKIGSHSAAFADSDAYLSDIAAGLGAGVTLSTRTNADNNHMSLRARGDVAFYTNTGTSSLSERMRIAAGGNVGIGTTSPSSPLHVLETGGSTSGVNTALILDYESDTTTVAEGGTAIEFRGKSSGGNIANYGQARIRSFGYAGNNSHGIAFDTRPSAVYGFTEAVRISNLGYVGIGTTSPSEKLHVAGESLFSATGSRTAKTTGTDASLEVENGLSIFNSTNSTYGWLFNSNASNDFGIYNWNRNGYVFTIEDSTPVNSFYLKSNGYLGVGTNFASQKLDVRYPAGGGMALLKSTDTNDGLLFGDMAYSTSNDWQGIKHAAMSGIWEHMMISNGTDTIISAGTGGSTYLRTGNNSNLSEIILKSTEVVINEGSTSNDFRVESNNNANMLFVDGIADKVGIGNASPVYTLDVTGNGHFTTSIKVEDNIYLGSTDSYIFGSNNSNNIRFYDASDYIILSTVNGGAVRFDTDIILQKSPNHPIYGPSKSFTFVDYYSSTYDGYSQAIRTYQPIVLESAAPIISRADIEMRIDSNNDSTSNKFFITKDAGTELFRIQEDGKVGIGTASPSTQLDVVGSGNFSGDVTIDGHLSAATKSFYIDHPTKEGKLQYGSLESPYHGIRLTGRGKIEGGKCVVELPDYISSLVRNDENINVQITNYKHSKILYVDDINIANNEFTVKCDSWFGGGKEFFWSFTAVRKDVQELKVEC